MNPEQLVRQLYEAYQARDWRAAETVLHPEATVELPATSERLVGREQVMRFQRDYPEPWGELSVLRVVGGPDTAAAEIEVRAPAEVLRMASFWQAGDGLLRDGTEYWVTVGEAPPPGRAHYIVSGS